MVGSGGNGQQMMGFQKRPTKKTYGVATMSRMLKIYVSLQNIGLFCRSLLQKRRIFLSILLIVATPYSRDLHDRPTREKGKRTNLL